MTKRGDLPEYAKPKAPHPIVTKLEQIDPSALSELVGFLSAIPPSTPASSVSGLGDVPTAPTGGTSIQTFGATTAAVSIPHGLTAEPRGYSVLPANLNARDNAFPYFLTVDDANITINFDNLLTPATEYAWVWTAIP